MPVDQRNYNVDQRNYNVDQRNDNVDQRNDNVDQRENNVDQRENSVDQRENSVNQGEKDAADLDQALDVAGIGWYNLKHCLILTFLLIACLVERFGISLVLPAAVCDLQMTDEQRGIIISLPYIGMLISAYPWGYLVDTQGRKKMLVYGSFGAGIFSLLAGLMPNTIGFSICKFLASNCLACPAAASYTYIAEILPSKYKDVFLSILNSTQLAGSALVPLLAWAILPLDFRIDFGLYIFRSWRLLNTIYAMFIIIIASILAFSPESPKFLVSQDKFDEALKVLQNMYAGNKGKKPEEFPIKKLLAPSNKRDTGNFLTSLKVQTMPLLKWVYLRWVLLNGFLLFGVNVVLNGLNIWVPDLLNRVLTDGGQERTACKVILDRFNQSSTGETGCNDKIDDAVLIINFTSRLCCTMVAIVAAATVKYIGKKNLIMACMLCIGFFCTSINIITNDVLFAIILSATPIVALTIGPVNAYTVEIFPTHLRGMAISLSTMLGRTGSVAGANGTGLMINQACELMFYMFGGLLFLCSASALLLPNSKTSPAKSSIQNNGVSSIDTKM